MFVPSHFMPKHPILSLAFAPPVSSPPSFYSLTSGLDVVTDRNRHSRSNSNRIHNLLNLKDPRPALTKAGKPKAHQQSLHKDETGHFYIIHSAVTPPWLATPDVQTSSHQESVIGSSERGGRLDGARDHPKVRKYLAAERLQRRSIRSRNRFERGQKRKKERSARGTDEDDLLADVQAHYQRGVQVDQGTTPGVSLLGRVLVPTRREISMLITSAPQVSKRLDISDLSGTFHIAATDVSNDRLGLPRPLTP